MYQTLCSLTACLFFLSSPDILPENVKPVLGETRLDLGPFADQVCVAYEVRKGDTLSSIARARFGDATRATEIAARNPSLKPDRLVIGQRLWMPPRDQTNKDPAYLFVRANGPGTSVQPCIADQALPPAHYGSQELYFVTQLHLEAFQAASTAGTQQQMAAKGTVQMVSAPSNPRHVDQGSPVKRVVTTIRLTKDAAGKPTATSHHTCFDKHEKQLDPGVLDQNPKPPEPAKQLLLLLFALGGGAWLWQCSRGRAQPTTCAANLA